MQRSNLKEEEYSALLQKIIPIVIENGLKSTTMDLVAAKLGISKRTLYEIFDSKSEMLSETFNELGRRNKKFVKDAFESSENVMEALIKVFKHARDNMQRMNPDFFKDMDRLYTSERESYNTSRDARYELMMHLYERGVEQGMFRTDTDFKVQSRIMGIQMESLKRMEEFFPQDINLIRVYDAIIVGFLRSIASEKGMKMLDNLTTEFIHN